MKPNHDGAWRSPLLEVLTLLVTALTVAASTSTHAVPTEETSVEAAKLASQNDTNLQNYNGSTSVQTFAEENDTNLHNYNGSTIVQSLAEEDDENMPIALSSYNGARFLLGTSTRTRLTTITSSTIYVCASVINAATCPALGRRRRKRSIFNKNKNGNAPESGYDDQIDSSLEEGVTSTDTDSRKKRILFYPATVFTTFSYTTFVASGKTVSLSLSCTPQGVNLNLCPTG